ncbi:MAG: hypothetical protein ABI835_09465 [Chloroflexota bacterium]
MKTVIIVSLSMLFALPAFAQETTAEAPVCTIEVSGVQDLLTQAAAAEPQAAVGLIVHAREALENIEQDCAAGGIVLLDELFTAPEETFTLSYPHGWMAGAFTPSAAGGVLFISSSPSAEQALQMAEPQIGGSQQAVQVLVGQPETREGDALRNVIADFEELVRSMYSEVSTTEYYTLGEYNAARISYRSSGFDGVIVGVDLGSGRFVVVRGVAAPSGLEGIRVIAEAIATSVR